jgi:hypothetical protein
MPATGELCLFFLYSGFNFLQDLLWKLDTIREAQTLKATTGNLSTNAFPAFRIENKILAAPQFREHLIRSACSVSNLLPQVASKNLLDEKVTVRNILCPICACYYRYDFAEAFPEVICEFFEQDV